MSRSLHKVGGFHQILEASVGMDLAMCDGSVLASEVVASLLHQLPLHPDRGGVRLYSVWHEIPRVQDPVVCLGSLSVALLFGFTVGGLPQALVGLCPESLRLVVEGALHLQVLGVLARQPFEEAVIVQATRVVH